MERSRAKMVRGRMARCHQSGWCRARTTGMPLAPWSPSCTSSCRLGTKSNAQRSGAGTAPALVACALWHLSARRDFCVCHHARTLVGLQNLQARAAERTLSCSRACNQALLHDCRFTHDAIRVADKVYVCNTDGGEILELQFPSMEVLRTFPLFTAREHINTLAAVDDDSLWVVLHNLGKVRHICSHAPACTTRCHVHSTAHVKFQL